MKYFPALYFYGDNFVKPFKTCMFKLIFYYISATHYCSKSSRVVIGQTHLEK